jgi:hypothetical protein
MIWYKGWFETRFKLGLAVGVLGLLLAFMHSLPATAQAPGAKPPIFAIVLTTNPIFMVWISTWLAGAGIATQSAFQATKGLHGSMLFTLSLPVSRLRLLTVRSGIGWLEMVGVIATLCCGMWLVSPALRSTVTPVEMVEYAGTLIAGDSALYFLSVWLATFLEDQWRILGTMAAFFALAWLSGHTSLPASVDILRAMGKGSPLIAHEIPWTAMAFSFGLAAILFFAALKIVQTREY